MQINGICDACLAEEREENRRMINEKAEKAVEGEMESESGR